MKYRNELHNQEWFLRDPRTRNWIVQCSTCQLYGRKPDAPRDIPKAKFFENFPEMKLNEAGQCEICAINS